jgi:DNA (cytosine-5)-methyltransferase 1
MRVVSLFSGAGGLDLGLQQAGHTIVWANDFDRDSCETYRLNIGSHIICEDITKVSTNEVPDCDVVVGGFPCQGFSLANRQRTVDDSRNTLYREFLRIVREKKPKYFIAENVRGILSLGKGDVIRKIVADFAAAGYVVSYQLLNFADYGVPQIRKRVLIFGMRVGCHPLILPKPTHPKANWVSVAQALDGLPEPDNGDHQLANHVCSRYKVTNRNFTGHRRTDPAKPSPTILARGNGGGGVCAIQHPENHRRMSVRESAVIQSFPLDFVFVGGLNSMYRQVGNAVPPRVGKLLGQALMEAEE